MEQNKYREQIQNGFIAPSKNAWEKLHQKLDAHEHSKNNSYKNYLKYAGSLAFIVSIGFYLLPTDNNTKIERIETEQQIEQIISRPSAIQQNNNALLEIKSEKVLAAKIPPNNHTLTYEVSKKIDIQEEVLSESTEAFEFKSNLHRSEIVSVSIPNKTVGQLDDEVEELMRIANLNLKIDDQNLNDSGMMAMDILGEVENDLKNDHRRKLFEKITIAIKNPNILEIADRNINK